MNLFLIALAFAGIMEASSVALSASWFWLGAFVAVFFVGASFWRIFASMSLSLIALSWAMASFYFLSLSQSPSFSQFVIIVSSVALYGLARTFSAKNPVFGVSLSFLIFLGSIFSLLRIQLLLGVSLLEIVPLVFISTFFLFFISEKLMLSTAELPLKIRLSVFSFGAAIFISELYVVFSSLPFTIFAIDFMLFIAYYTLWDMTMRYFSQSFTKRSLIGNITWFVFSFILILLSVLLFHPSL